MYYLSDFFVLVNRLNRRLLYLLFIKNPYIYYKQMNMVFSKTCEYAIRAVIFIAQKSEKGAKIGIKEIAEGIDSRYILSQNFSGS